MISWIRKIFNLKDEIRLIAKFFCDGFPLEMKETVMNVVNIIPKKTYLNVNLCV